MDAVKKEDPSVLKRIPEESGFIEKLFVDFDDLVTSYFALTASAAQMPDKRSVAALLDTSDSALFFWQMAQDELDQPAQPPNDPSKHQDALNIELNDRLRARFLAQGYNVGQYREFLAALINS